MIHSISSSNLTLSLACLSTLVWTALAAPLFKNSALQRFHDTQQRLGPPARRAFIPLAGSPSGRFQNTLFPFPGAPTASTPPPAGSTARSIAVTATPSVSPSPPIESTSNSPAALFVTSPAAGPSSQAPSLSPAITSTPASAHSRSPLPPAATSKTPSSSGHTFQLAFVNNLSSDNVKAYVTGLDNDGKVILLTPDGSFYYPAGSQATPQLITADIAIPVTGSSTSVTIPAYMSSGRIWLSDGDLQFSTVSTSNGPGLVEPTAVNPDDASHDVNWGFTEFTFNAEVGLFADISYVDFVGIPLGMELQTVTNGNHSALGMPADGASQVCSLLQAKGEEDGQPWADLCVSGSGGETLRVISPSVLISNQATAFNNYWDNYLTLVYATYASEPLTFNTQSSAGNVQCTSSSSGSSFSCAAGAGTFSNPTAADVFGCASGPFSTSTSTDPATLAIIPRLCAGLNRGTLLTVPGGNLQPSLPPAQYYQDEVCNWYSAMVHKVELDGKGYAFPYDDVAPEVSEDTAGIVADLEPVILVVTVGGPGK